MSMVYLDAPPLSDYQLRPHCVVVSCFKLLVRIKVRMVASLDPHVEAGVVSPASSH